MVRSSKRRAAAPGPPALLVASLAPLAASLVAEEEGEAVELMAAWMDGPGDTAVASMVALRCFFFFG